jgi:cytochrome c
MKRLLIAALMAVAGTSAHAVDVAKAQGLAQKNACMGCHAVDRKLVGPSYQDVAAKYKGNKGASAALAAKIKTGGAGVWGQVPMPANPGLSDADSKLLADWVLAGAPAK